MGLYVTLNEESAHFFQFCCLKHWCGMGAERVKNLVSGNGAVSRCEKNCLEREVAEWRTEWRVGVIEISLSDERKFCRSRSAHMLWSTQILDIT